MFLRIDEWIKILKISFSPWSSIHCYFSWSSWLENKCYFLKVMMGAAQVKTHWELSELNACSQKVICVPHRFLIHSLLDICKKKKQFKGLWDEGLTIALKQISSFNHSCPTNEFYFSHEQANFLDSLYKSDKMSAWAIFCFSI